MRLGLVVGWLAFAAFVAFASPAHYWLDSGEIAAAGAELGVMHPPGAPGLTLLLRAATTIPLGSLGFRMALLSSLLGGITVGGVVAFLRERGTHPWIAVGAAMWLAASWTFSRQARVVEIYALQGALMVVVLWGFAPLRSEAHPARRLLGTMAAVWAAWCFGDARLALVVPVVIGWIVALVRKRVWARWAPLVVVLSSAVLWTLPLSSSRNPITDWGDPQTWSAMWDHVMAGSIRRAYEDAIWPDTFAMWQLNAQAVLDGLAQDLGPLGPAIGLCAVVALAWRPAAGRGERGVAAGLAWLLGVELLYAVAINPMGVAERQTGLVTALVLTLAVAEVMRRHVQPRGRAVWAVVPLAFVILAGPAVLRTQDDLANTRSWGPASWTRGALAQLPPGGLFLTQSDDLSAGMVAARVLEGARPDVVTIPAQHLYRPVPDWALPGSPTERVWAAGLEQPDEASRIIAAMQAHRGSIAVEGATTGVLGGVPWWSDRGVAPLRIQAPDPSVHDALPLVDDVSTTIEHWRVRAPAAEDARRLAWALANEARGRVRAYRDERGAKETLEMIAADVTDREAGTWVTLGALRDRFGQTALAIEATRRALELEPGRPRALTNLALYLSRDRTTLEEARDVAEYAIALRPRDGRAWIRLSSIRELQGDVEGADQARRRAQELLQ